MSLQPNPKIAIVCDWLTGIGGAERVVLELHRMFPDAPIYTSQYDPEAIDWFADADVRITWLQRLPKSLKKFLPVLRALAFSRLDLSDYNLVISCSGSEAKAVRVKPPAVHICYCFAPTHYYWGRYEQYLALPGFGKFDPLARLGLKLLAGPMRHWDYRIAQRPDYMIAISTHIQRDIQKYYDRNSIIVHPPVDVDRFRPQHAPAERHGFVIAGRQVPYKRIDLAVAACTRLKLPLAVIGNGPEHEKLVKMAGPSITFLTNESDTDVVADFQSAQAFIFPGLDDFGITPVEAMAAGTPVIAYRAGGALDYIVPGKTGEFFDEQTVESLIQALKTFDARQFNPVVIRKQAQNFSAQKFRTHFKEFLTNNLVTP